ncbi:unnamed protein product [Brachionus calyciflorus]|uniref:Uncharacterized protein n=1 Tax=Brachionus calyciflorus TaxID=104777 RepID=A0A814KX28_9BILA|nr:unnamed protein product [Brachionus calyciflorus]
MSYQDRPPIGFMFDFIGSEGSKQINLTDASSQISSNSSLQKSSSTNSYCDLHVNNELNSEDNTLDNDFNYPDNFILNSAQINHTKPFHTQQNIIFEPKYHSIPIYIEQKPKTERKYRKISNLKKQKNEKVKFGNVNYLHYPNEFNQERPRPQSTPAPFIRESCQLENFRQLSNHEIDKNFSETDTDDFLTHIRNQKPKYPRHKRPLNKGIGLRQTSHAQSNRLSEFNPKYSDLIVQNTSSFINSPIHLLMNYQKNLKEQKMYGAPKPETIPEEFIYEPLNLEFKPKYYLGSLRDSNNREDSEISLLRDSENSDLSLNHRDNLIVRSSSQLNELHSLEHLNRNLNTNKKLKALHEEFLFNRNLRFKFRTFVLGLFIFNLSIILIFILNFLTNAYDFKFLKEYNLYLELAGVILGGFGFALFVKHLVINLLDMSYENNELKNNGIVVCQIEIEDKCLRNRTLFQKQHIQMRKNLEKLILKLFISIKSSYFLVSCVIYYMNNLTTNESLDKVLNKFCLEWIDNYDRLYCPKSMIKNSYFNWLDEISHRKINLILKAKKLGNNVPKRLYVGLELDGSNNKTFIDETNKNLYASSEDFYLIVTILSIVILFICLSIAFSCIKMKNKKNKETNIKENYDLDETNHKSRNTFVLTIHFSMVMVFYQGFIKTIDYLLSKILIEI